MCELWRLVAQGGVGASPSLLDHCHHACWEPSCRWSKEIWEYFCLLNPFIFKTNSEAREIVQATDQVFVWPVCKLPTRPPPEPCTLLLQVPTVTHSLGSPSLRNRASEPVILTDVVRCIKTLGFICRIQMCITPQESQDTRYPASAAPFNPTRQASLRAHCPTSPYCPST